MALGGGTDMYGANGMPNLYSLSSGNQDDPYGLSLPQGPGPSTGLRHPALAWWEHGIGTGQPALPIGHTPIGDGWGPIIDDFGNRGHDGKYYNPSDPYWQSSEGVAWRNRGHQDFPDLLNPDPTSPPQVTPTPATSYKQTPNDIQRMINEVASEPAKTYFNNPSTQPTQPTQRDYGGFVPPPEGSINTQAAVRWYNKATGETANTRSGGWSHPDPNWVRGRLPTDWVGPGRSAIDQVVRRHPDQERETSPDGGNKMSLPGGGYISPDILQPRPRRLPPLLARPNAKLNR